MDILALLTMLTIFACGLIGFIGPSLPFSAYEQAFWLQHELRPKGRNHRH